MKKADYLAGTNRMLSEVLKRDLDVDEFHELAHRFKRIFEREKEYNEKRYYKREKYKGVTKETRFYEFDLSARTRHILAVYLDAGREIYQKKVSDLSRVSITEIMAMRHAGVKTANEIKEICGVAGVKLLP